MVMNKTVFHRSDLNRLPEGAMVIKVLYRYSYEQISSIVEYKVSSTVMRMVRKVGMLYAISLERVNLRCCSPTDIMSICILLIT